MRIHNLYEDANGESHFRDIDVDWIEGHRQLDGPRRHLRPGIGVSSRVG